MDAFVLGVVGVCIFSVVVALIVGLIIRRLEQGDERWVGLDDLLDGPSETLDNAREV